MIQIIPHGASPMNGYVTLTFRLTNLRAFWSADLNMPQNGVTLYTDLVMFSVPIILSWELIILSHTHWATRSHDCPFLKFDVRNIAALLDVFPLPVVEFSIVK